MKYLLIITLLTMTVFSYGQQYIHNLNFYKTKALTKSNEVAQKHFEKKYEAAEPVAEQWSLGIGYDYESEQETEMVVLAFFKKEKLSYTVVYTLEGEWLGTEKRLTQKRDVLDYGGDYPSYDILPKKVRRALQNNEYGMNPYNDEVEEGAFMDAFEIEIPSTHPMVETHNSTIFYIVNWDGVCIAATNEGKIKTEKFYRFY